MAHAHQLHEVRPSFNGSVRFEGRPESLTTNTGALVLREVMDRLGLRDWLQDQLHDPRSQDAITHPQIELLMTMLLLISQRWQDQDDADWFRHDPALKLAVSNRRGTSPLQRRPELEDASELSKNPSEPDGLGSQPTLSRLVSVLGSARNRVVMRQSLLECATRRIRADNNGHPLRHVTIDVDSIPVEVHGQQEDSEYNGHYHCRMFHPLVASIGETGDILDMKLRHGKAHTAEGDLGFILPLLDRVEGSLCQVASVRIDAGFPDEELLSALEHRQTGYVARIKNNAVLNRMAEPYLKRPRGRRPAKPRTWFYEMSYQAQSWSCARRVVLVVLEKPGELLLHHFWLITNWSVEQIGAEDLLALYRRRGLAESRFGELMSVLQPALSSATRTKTHYRGKTPKKRTTPVDPVANNEALLLLYGLAYNIVHAARLLIERAQGTGWSLQRFIDLVLRAPARIVVHARYATIILPQQLASLWQTLWSKLKKFRYSPEPA